MITVYTPDTPGGRYERLGDHSAEAWRRDVLVPALILAFKQGTYVTVDFSRALGLPASFLEEVFGGLVRSESFVPSVLCLKLIFRLDGLPEAADTLNQIWSHIWAAHSKCTN